MVGYVLLQESRNCVYLIALRTLLVKKKELKKK